MLKRLYAWWQWLISATALPTRDELDAELDRLSPPPSWPVNPMSLPPRMSHTVPTLPSGPPDTTEGDEPTRLADIDWLTQSQPRHVLDDPSLFVIHPSPVPVPQTAAHDAQAAQGRSYFQPHIAKGQ